MLNVMALGQSDIRITNQQSQEQDWALAARNGDEKAFLNIVSAYQGPVYNLCYRMLGTAEDAEDAAQETFLRAYTKLHSYNPKRKFSSWILSVASHHCIDRLRKRRFQVLSWDDLPPHRSFATNEPQPEDVTLQHERQAEVQALLNRLPPDYRAAIILRYWYELSYEEIAETLDTTVSAIKSRLFRARKTLAEKYHEG